MKNKNRFASSLLLVSVMLLTLVSLMPVQPVAAAEVVTALTPAGVMSSWNEFFTWEGTDDATWYSIAVYNSSNTLIYSHWYEAASSNCVSSICSVQAAEILNLPDGDYRWYVYEYVSEFETSDVEYFTILSPTATYTPTATSTATETLAPTATSTIASTETFTPIATYTETSTPTETNTPGPTLTPLPIQPTITYGDYMIVTVVLGLCLVTILIGFALFIVLSQKRK